MLIKLHLAFFCLLATKRRGVIYYHYFFLYVRKGKIKINQNVRFKVEKFFKMCKLSYFQYLL